MDDLMAVLAAWLPVVIIVGLVFFGVVTTIAITIIVKVMRGIFSKNKNTNDWF